MASTNSARVAKIKDTVKTLVNQHFSATLLREADIVNLVNALIYQESSFNVNALGPTVKYGPRTMGNSYFSSSAVQAKFHGSSTPEERANIFQGLNGIGLMQVMGWNFVKGGNPTGKSEIEQLRPDLAGSLVVNPGESISNKILGEANMERAILSGLIILEGKYRLAKMVTSGSGTYFVMPGDPYTRKFISRIQAAISGYLGLGKSDNLGTTPESYASNIIGGAAYARANGGGSLYIRDSEVKVASVNGPSSTGPSPQPITIPGCSA